MADGQVGILNDLNHSIQEILNKRLNNVTAEDAQEIRRICNNMMMEVSKKNDNENNSDSEENILAVFNEKDLDEMKESLVDNNNNNNDNDKKERNESLVIKLYKLYEL